jgi:hypothetical protein
MKKIFVAGFLLSSVSLIAQQDSTERQPFYGDHVWVRVNFECGMTNIHPDATAQAIFGHKTFDQLITLGASESISFEPVFKNGLFGHDLTLAAHGYITDKQRVTDLAGNRYEYKLQGWEGMTSLIGFDFFANRNIDLLVGVGLSGGVLKLYQTNLTDSVERKYINPFIGPMGRAELRFNFGFVTIGGRLMYRYDITHDIWQRRSDGLNGIPGYKFRDTQFMIYVGLRGPFV